MRPERTTTIDGHAVAEYYWAGDMVVYLDGRFTEMGYDQACEQLRNNAQDEVEERASRSNGAIPAIKQRPGESHWTAIERHLREEQVDRWGEFNLRLQLIRGIEVQAVGAALSGGRIADVEHAFNRLRDMVDALIRDGAKR